ncbi:LCP family protein, partial [Streptomyces alkaliterrae]
TPPAQDAPYPPVATSARTPRPRTPQDSTQDSTGRPAADSEPTDRRGEDGPADEEYRTDEFSFIEEKNDESEDVIDWLKFSESRTERREEAKRRGRNRVVAGVVVLVLALTGGLGYLWSAGKLPGFAETETATDAKPDTRHVIVVHLRELGSGDISTALLVNNQTAARGTTVLLPNSLALASGEGGATTLGRSFAAEGAGATRDALNALLGARIEGTWRLDTPYLENLVEMVGGITVKSDATVPGEKDGDRPLVKQGAGQELNGVAAVAYATHRGESEPQTKQLARFGQVMQAVLKKVSTDEDAATTTVESLGQIPDPHLSEAQLGAALARLAKHARAGAYRTELLPVESDGTLSEKTAQGLVKEVLGGSVTNADPQATARLSVRDASGSRGAADDARVTLVNGGFTVVSTGAADAPAARSTITYRRDDHAEQAKEAARTLGLAADAVTKGEGAANADITVVLGADYKP